MLPRLPALAALLLCLHAVSARAAAHPSLFFEPGALDTLRAQAQGTHQAAFGPLAQGTAFYRGTTIAPSGTITWTATGRTEGLGDRRDIGNALAVFAFVAQVGGDARDLELARRWTLQVASWGDLDLDGTRDLVQAHLTAGLAVAYDLLAPSLSSTEAAQVRQTLSRNASALAAASREGIWWAHEYLQNHNWVNHAAVGLAALAVRGELPDSTTGPWLSLAVENGRRVAGLLEGVTDGTWHEGFAYAWYGLSWHLPFVMALQRATGEDLGDVAFLRAFPRALAAVQLPERPHHYALVNGDFYGFSRDGGLLPLRYAASRFRDGVAQAVADAWVAGAPVSTYAPELHQRVFEFLAWDASVPAADLGTLPLDWSGDDLQVAAFRSGRGPGSLVFALKSGTFGGEGGWTWQRDGLEPLGGLNFGHNHADDNGFYFYGRGAWLAPEAAGYYIGHVDSPGPQANKTEFHNALTIDGVGQLGEGVHASGDELASYPWAFERVGALPFVASSAHFSYAVGDGAGLYPASLGLTRWDRHALFLDRQWVVLRDVVAASAPHTYRWLVHFMAGGAREGQWLHGRADAGQALGVAVVAPASFDASFRTQSPVNVDKLSASGSVTLAEVSPATASARATFLTALVPVAEADWASRPQVTALDARAPDAGLRVTAGSTVAVAVFNDAPPGTRDAGGYALAGLAGAVRYDSGAPTRAALVRGTRLADAEGARVLLSQEAPSGMLEADGLQAETLLLSGDWTGTPRVWAPRAREVRWNGEPLAFTREGEHVVVGVAPAPPPADGGTEPEPPGQDAGTEPPGWEPAAQQPGQDGVVTLPPIASTGPGTVRASGCSVGGGHGVVGLALGVLALLRRRRRG